MLFGTLFGGAVGGAGVQSLLSGVYAGVIFSFFATAVRCGCVMSNGHSGRKFLRQFVPIPGSTDFCQPTALPACPPMVRGQTSKPLPVVLVLQGCKVGLGFVWS